MEVHAHSSSPARCPRGRSLLARLTPSSVVYVALWVVLLLLLGCGSARHGSSSSSSLVVGERAAPIPRAQLALAAKVAQRFAVVYARSVYLAQPPPLPGATPAVERELAAAATHIPLARRGRHPRAVGLQLTPASADRLDASVEIDDRRSPPFSIGFTVAGRGAYWRVVSISAPE